MSDKKKTLPIILSVVLHLALIGAIVWKFIWEPNIPEHKYVDAPIQARIAQAPKTNPPPPSANEQKKREEKQREEERLKKQQQEKERLEKLKREKELAEQKAKEEAAAEQRAKEQAELERKKKLALEKKLEEEKRKKEEAEKKRLAEEKRKKEEAEKKRLAEEKRKKEEAERKKREEAERKRQEEIERLQKELAAEDGEFFDAMEGDVKKAQALTELEKLKAQIRSKLVRLWNKPSEPGSCTITIKTAPGGVVLDTIIVGGDDVYCQTGIAAINRASPLPYSDNPDVIEELRTITFTFDPSLKD